MPNPNVLLSTVSRVDQPVNRSLHDLIRGPGGFSFDVADGRRLWLDSASPNSIGQARLLVELHRLNLLVYLEIDPATSTVKQLLIPRIGRVVAMTPANDDAFAVELNTSHARHVLPVSHPDFAAIENELRDALGSGTPIVLTDDGRVIVHARTFIPDQTAPCRPCLCAV
jgi:hypothetical protein